MIWGGMSYDAAPALTLTGVVYHQDIKKVAPAAKADPIMYVGRAKYALSKRTDLYTVLTYAKAEHDLNVGLSRDDPGFGSTQTGFALGMQHRF
jgi:predicted porin